MRFVCGDVVDGVVVLFEEFVCEWRNFIVCVIFLIEFGEVGVFKDILVGFCNFSIFNCFLRVKMVCWYFVKVVVVIFFFWKLEVVCKLWYKC